MKRYTLRTPDSSDATLLANSAHIGLRCPFTTQRPPCPRRDRVHCTGRVSPAGLALALALPFAIALDERRASGVSMYSRRVAARK
eukprot:3759063-Pleurochrysis_carterae.AAC.2